jgi:uncharacterized membrane protein YbaN (DUF454 family)
MESASLEHTVLLDRIEPGEADGVSPCLDIEFDERGGSVRVYDPRLFHAGRRGFCERLLEAAARQPGIYKAEVDLASASCQIEFSPGSTTPQCMADSFAHAVREASAGCTWVDRVSWWRRRGRWSALTAFRLPEGFSLWETFEVEAARIRVRRPGVTGNRARLSRLADTLADLEGVEACHVSPWFHRITVDVCLDSPLSDRFLDTAEQALREIRAADWLPPKRRTHAQTADAGDEVAFATTTGWKRLMYLALAGGSFAMTLVALVVPGIPTVPFLLATSHCLARSSPRLNERLRHTLFFGPILREGEHQGGLSRFSKRKLTVLALVIVSVTVMFKTLTPVALVLIIFISSLSIYGIARMSDLPDEPHGGLQLNGQVFLALPAP